MVRYILSSKFTSKERQKALSIITRSVEKQLTSTEIINKLSNANLNYRKQNLLSDIGRKKATIRALTPEAREKANTWYDDILEKFRIDKGIKSRKEASILWNRAVEQTAVTVLEAKENAEFWDYYHEVFGDN